MPDEFDFFIEKLVSAASKYSGGSIDFVETLDGTPFEVAEEIFQVHNKPIYKMRNDDLLYLQVSALRMIMSCGDNKDNAVKAFEYVVKFVQKKADIIRYDDNHPPMS